MKKIFWILALLTCIQIQGKDIRKAVYIIVDGVPADMIEKIQPAAIDSISKSGGYSRGYTGGEIGGVTETPTISAVGYNNILTATWANKHNVWNNDIKEPNYYYPSLFWVARHCKKDMKLGVFSGWEENLTKLIGEDAIGTGMLHIDFTFNDSDKNKEKYPENDPLRIFNLDQDVTDLACRYIINEGPDVSWVYLWFMDDAGHKYGTDCKEYEKYLQMVDRQVSQIWSAVKTREKKTGEKWLTIVTADHGRTSTAEGKHHGGQSERERSVWVAMDKPGNEYFMSETPVSLTDITPTICNYVSMKVPQKIAREWEGIPMIGNIDFSNFKVIKDSNIIKFTWKGYSKNDVIIRMCTTDNTRTGEVNGKDQWIVIGKRPAKEEYYEWNCKNLESEFYKFSIEGPKTIEGAWISSH